MTIAHWSQVLFALGVIALLAGAWFTSTVLSLLGAALMVPMLVLISIYVRKMQ